VEVIVVAVVEVITPTKRKSLLVVVGVAMDVAVMGPLNASEAIRTPVRLYCDYIRK